METSPEIKNIAEALTAFQSLGVTVTKDATNPHFRSKFASLDNIIESIRQPLAESDLAIAQFPDGDGLTTVLVHKSGEWMKATANLKLAKEDPQGQGSAYTYARRYALSAILGLATDEDDDGNEATKPSQTRHAAPRATKEDKAAEASARSGISKEDKIKIAELLSKLGKFDKDTVAITVHQLTDLALIPEAVPQIIDRLEALKEEKENDQ